MAVATADPGRTIVSPSTTARPDGVRHRLYAHCGVVSTTMDGVLWLAEPVLRDEGQNPPPGWDENSTEGWFHEISADAARFTADTGATAAFRRAPAGTPDPNEGCE